MSSAEPNPGMPTWVLRRRIRQEFPKLFQALKDRKDRDWSTLPFVGVEVDRKTEEMVVSFFYQGGMIHSLLFCGRSNAFLESHLELVYLCSELYHRHLATHLEVPEFVPCPEKWAEIERRLEEAPARLIVSSTGKSQKHVNIEFHPG